MMRMDDLISEFPLQLETAVNIADKITLPRMKVMRNAVLMGMGGSGIGGTLVKQFVIDKAEIPVQDCKDYHLPNFVNHESLVVLCSFSGGTEETISCYQQAKEKGATVMVISSGGKLSTFAINNGDTLIQIPGGQPPRTALGYSLVQILKIFELLGYINTPVSDTVRFLVKSLAEQKEVICKEAKEIAGQLKDKIPVIYSSTKYEAIAIRFRQQINENAKALCWNHVIPEMNHNEIIGWERPANNVVPIFIDSKDEMSEAMKKRFEVTRDLIGKKASHPIVNLYVTAENKLQGMFELIHLVDWVSYYLCLEHQVDAIKIKNIDHLKEELAKLS